uniref:DegV family protein n=1 Tax=uncultured Flavonifractor sp. TaxID=1193534 RepID=UPI00260789B1|nr:DegV family protein [uncultured Flavonifractor sp.]
MSKIAIATDSNSGITQAQGKELGIFVLPMPFYINDELFLEDITLSQEQFYQRLEEGADVKTTQPSPGDVTDLWDKILQDYDQIVYIPMSSGLSSSCETAMMLAQDYEGKVFVVNNQRISVTQRQSVLDAKAMAQAGKSAQEIHDYLERTKFDSDIYITVDTLKYLKKGGRCTPAAAALGAVLGIKPVLRIKGEKLDSFAKVRGWKAAKKSMIDAIRHTMDTDFAGLSGPEQLHIAAAYTGDRAAAEEWLKELEATFPGYPIHMDPLSLSVACHIGPGAQAVTVSKALELK